ncbi:PHP domain-containing protein [candidate division KSB1 bacterium]|nr:PHP domain-containing protein [candidate division KSB1 bacterium]
MRYLKLKVDLHLHNSRDMAENRKNNKRMVDPKDYIDMAVEKGFDAIAFTHHGLLYHDPKISRYAREKGIILIPGIEAYIKRKHVLLINYARRKHIVDFDTLRKEKTDDMIVIAPHPFYKTRFCLEDELEKNIDCFDAVEYCHFYTRLINPNRKALRLARKHSLPMVGNSDAHHAYQFGTTYSYVYANDRSVTSIIEAIKAGRVEYVSQPLPLRKIVALAYTLILRVPTFSSVFLRKMIYKYRLEESLAVIKLSAIYRKFRFAFSKSRFIRNEDIATT